MPKKKLTLSFENYKQISNMLILHIRNEEARAEAGEKSSSSEGLKRSDIVNWYLQECADDIESEEDLVERKSLVEKVLDRLCYHDQVIIPLRSTGLRTQDADAPEDDPILVAHPNYVIE